MTWKTRAINYWKARFFLTALLGLFAPSSLLESVQISPISRNIPMKCAVVDRDFIVNLPGEAEIKRLEDEDTFDQILEHQADVSKLVLTSVSGRILWQSTVDKTDESSLLTARSALIQTTNQLPSGIYALHPLLVHQFLPVVGDTIDNASGVGDLDGDGDDDVILAGYSNSSGSPPIFFSSDGSGGLIEEFARLPQVDMKRTADIVIFDADNDVDLDIFFVNIDERNRLFINNGSGFFSDESDSRIPADTLAHMSGDFADIDHDGDFDLIITGFDAPFQGPLESFNWILVNDGTGHFSDESSGRFLDGLVLDTSMDGVFIDIENDNDPDIVISNDNILGHKTKLYRNDGTGHFTDVTAERLPDLSGSSWRIAVGDLIPNQYLDFYIANSWNELNFLLENDGTGSFLEVGTLKTPLTSYVDSSFSTSCVIMDLNLDTYPDIVVGNLTDVVMFTHPSQNRLLLNDGSGFFTDCTDSTPSLIPIYEDDTWDLDVLDANDDEIEDLFVTNASSVSRLYLNDDGRLPIEEESSSGTVCFPQAIALHQNYPNPFNPSTTIQYDIPAGESSIPVDINIYDSRGRLVRELMDEKKTPGRYQVHWDGRDNRGQQASSGVYLYRIETREFVETRKMIMLR